MRLLRHHPLLVLCVALALLGATSCGAGTAADGATAIGGDEFTTTPDGPQRIVGDTSVDEDVFSGRGPGTEDTTGGGGGSPDDVGPSESDDDASDQDDDAGPVTTADLKDDDVYLVPPGVRERSELALGAGVAAWVERDAPGDSPRIAVWDLETLAAPAVLALPFLVSPRELALGDGWLFYVDDRYGDADVFAVRLADGTEHPVVALPGDQDQPTAAGTTVAWRDCRACVAGAGDAPAEIYSLDVAADDAVEERLTDDDAPDRSPAFGTLADGGTGLAWLTGDDRLKARSADGALTTIVAPASVAALALTYGVISWRESVSIINPDSMMPDDVFGTPLDGGETFAYSEHAELLPGLDSRPSASAGQVAWLESVPGEVPLNRAVVADATTGEQLLTVEAPGVDQPRLSATADYLAFTAPRADNGGQADVWVLPLGD